MRISYPLLFVSPRNAGNLCHLSRSVLDSFRSYARSRGRFISQTRLRMSRAVPREEIRTPEDLGNTSGVFVLLAYFETYVGCSYSDGGVIFLLWRYGWETSQYAGPYKRGCIFLPRSLPLIRPRRITGNTVSKFRVPRFVYSVTVRVLRARFSTILRSIVVSKHYTIVCYEYKPPRVWESTPRAHVEIRIVRSADT